MALLLGEALDSGAPPSMARLSITPEEVAAAYDAAEAAEDAVVVDNTAPTGANDGGRGRPRR